MSTSGGGSISARSRFGWAVVVASLALLIAAIVLFVQDPDLRVAGLATDSFWGALAIAGAALLCTGFGGFLTSRRPQNLVSWIFLITGFVFAFGAFLERYVIRATVADRDAGGGIAAWLVSWLVGLALWLALILLLSLFPNGRILGTRWKGVPWIGVLGTVLAAAGTALNPEGVPGNLDPPWSVDAPVAGAMSGLGWLLTFTALLLAASSIVVRFRRGTVDERRQLKWVAISAALVFTGVAGLITTKALALEPEVQALTSLFAGVTAVGLASIPVTSTIGILKHRLYDIDLVINRTIVYTLVIAVLFGMYVALVVAAREIFMGREFASSLVATAVVAVSFQPLRVVVQRAVDRALFGQRSDPYGAISTFAQHVGSRPADSELLATVVQTITQILKLPYVALEFSDRQRDPVSCGVAAGELRRFPVVFGQREHGALVVSSRSGRERLSSDDERILEDFARHTGVLIHSIQLAEQLQRSRERIVSTREEERKRLRRDLHDGLGSALAGIRLQIEAASDASVSHPDAARRHLAELKANVQRVTLDVRSLVHDIRPESLDQLGLFQAVVENAEDLRAGGLQVDVEGSPLGDLPAAVEVAAYRIVSEALTNVVRHARAQRCAILLSADGSLFLEVRDDGTGIGDGSPEGIGLTSMRERAEELGGRLEVASGNGTVVRAWLPLNDV